MLASRQERIEYHHELYRQRIPMVMVVEGWDASGKGGNIRRLTEKMDPRGYEVIPIMPPMMWKRHSIICGVSGRNSQSRTCYHL